MNFSETFLWLQSHQLGHLAFDLKQRLNITTVDQLREHVSSTEDTQLGPELEKLRDIFRVPKRAPVISRHSCCQRSMLPKPSGLQTATVQCP